MAGRDSRTVFFGLQLGEGPKPLSNRAAPACGLLRTWSLLMTGRFTAISLCLASAGCSLALDVDALGDGCPDGTEPAMGSCVRVELESGPDACAADEFRSKGECRPLTKCDAGEYESRSPTPTRDRQCLALTDCVPGEYELQGPASDEDRRCAECADGSFSSSINAVSCENWSPCEPGEAEREAPTSKSDRICSSCESGTFEHDGQCFLVTTCEAGTYVDAEATPTSDRRCRECPDETFSSEENAPSCQPWRQCEEDEVQSDDDDDAPSAVRDRVCVSCASDEFVQGGRCLLTTPCAADEYETVAPSATEDRECSECLVDEWVDGERICSPVGQIQNYWALDWFINIEDGVLGATQVDLESKSTQWSLEPIDGYYRIRHRYERDQYLHIENGELEVGPVSRSWSSAQWRLIDVTSDFQTSGAARVHRIKNRSEPEVYLHVQDGVLEAGPIDSVWHSAVWYLPPL